MEYEKARSSKLDEALQNSIKKQSLSQYIEKNYSIFNIICENILSQYVEKKYSIFNNL